MDASIIIILSTIIISSGMYTYLLGKHCKKHKNSRI